MNYDPRIHHRCSIRLKNYDYSQPGAYFVTICVHCRVCLFGEIINGKMQLNEVGQIVVECFKEIPQHFRNVEHDVFVVMPNHIHGILFITPATHACRHAGPKTQLPIETSWARHASPLHSATPKLPPLGTIVGSFKSAVTRRVNLQHNLSGKCLWQRNYYEHVVRDEAELQQLREYVVNNSLNGNWMDCIPTTLQNGRNRPM